MQPAFSLAPGLGLPFNRTVNAMSASRWVCNAGSLLIASCPPKPNRRGLCRTHPPHRLRNRPSRPRRPGRFRRLEAEDFMAYGAGG